MAFYSNDQHFAYQKINRHWNDSSEKYAGGDSLLTALAQGWELGDTVYYEDLWYAGSRQVTIFHVELHHDGETIDMPVLGNPYIRRMLPEMCSQVLPISERPSGLKNKSQ